MQTTFLNAAGTVLFVRDDMEQGNWTQEEYTVNATFPYVAGKVITRGMRVSFRDPATNGVEIFEVRNVTNTEPEHYQQIIAEHIAVSELSDDHFNNADITDKTSTQALTTVLTGTLWAVGNDTLNTTSSVKLSRGSVWNAVCSIATNWNAYITPRVTVNSSGAITGRYLDIAPAAGTWRGVRLSISKNMADSSVVYDDSEVYTALYGYGGTVDKAHTTGDDTTEELTFADVVWTATSAHPAKPANQTYIEDPAKTALYGRNGRPRYGFYQNGDIKDASVLLQKTWEALQATYEPKISITGTVADLYRLGYKDQPLRLHDTAIVEIKETGEKFQKTIIKLDIDLIDPTASRPTIGDYVPNIIYINNETAKSSGGGGGGGSGQTKEEYEQAKTYSGFEKDSQMIAMVVGTRNGDNYVKAAEIALSINESGSSGSYETTAYINANRVNISATNTAYALAGEMERDASGKLLIKSAGGMYVQRTDQGGVTSQFGVWDQGNLTGGVMVQQINGDTTTYITGNRINISGTNTVQTLAGAMERDSSGHLVIKEGAGLYAEHTVSGSVAKFGVWDRNNLTGGVMVQQINGQSTVKISGDVVDINGSSITISASRVDLSGYVTVSELQATDAKITNLTSGATTANTLKTILLSASTGFDYQGSAVAWRSKEVVTGVTPIKTTSKSWALSDGSAWIGQVMTSVSVSSVTIHYLGGEDT